MLYFCLMEEGDEKERNKYHHGGGVFPMGWTGLAG
jgi:hypothetical protein